MTVCISVLGINDIDQRLYDMNAKLFVFLALFLNLLAHVIPKGIQPEEIVRLQTYLAGCCRHSQKITGSQFEAAPVHILICIRYEYDEDPPESHSESPYILNASDTAVILHRGFYYHKVIACFIQGSFQFISPFDSVNLIFSAAESLHYKPALPFIIIRNNNAFAIFGVLRISLYIGICTFGLNTKFNQAAVFIMAPQPHNPVDDTLDIVITDLRQEQEKVIVPELHHDVAASQRFLQELS